MTDQNTRERENPDIILNRIASELERLKSATDKLLDQIYNSPGAGVAGNIKKKAQPPFSGLKYPDVRNLIIDLRGKLFTTIQISKTIARRWPKNPEKHVSKSSVHRFIMMAKRGQLDYYDSFDISR